MGYKVVELCNSSIFIIYFCFKFYVKVVELCHAVDGVCASGMNEVLTAKLIQHEWSSHNPSYKYQLVGSEL